MYKNLLDEHSLYAEADKLILSNQMEAMTTLLESTSEDFKTAGTLLGTNFKEGLISEIKNALQDVSDLTGGKLNIGNATGGSTSTNTDSSDPDSTNEYEGVTDSGTKYTVTDGGIFSDRGLSDAEIDEIHKKTQRFATGGRTGNLGEDGKS